MHDIVQEQKLVCGFYCIKFESNQIIGLQQLSLCMLIRTGLGDGNLQHANCHPLDGRASLYRQFMS